MRNRTISCKAHMGLAIILALLLCLWTGCALAGEAEGFTYTDNGDGTCTITGYSGTSASVEIPAEIDGLAVTAIGRSAFANNTGITSVVIPEGVTSIGVEAFRQCRNLQNVSLPDTLVTIDNYAFPFCSSLEELAIPAATTEIGWAFYGMPTVITVDSANTAYKTIDNVLYTIDGKTLKFCPKNKQGVFSIPEGTVTIDEMAFFGCGELTEILIPASVTAIASDTFGETYAMTGFVVDEDNAAYKSVNGMLLSKDGTLLHTVPMTVSGTAIVPDGVKTIGYGAFRGSKTCIVLPDGVTTLEDNSFVNQYSLEKINLPASITSISTSAFYNLNSECVATVYENTLAHRWCVQKGIKVEVLPYSVPDSDPADFTCTDNGDGTCTITGYTGASGDVRIPAEIAGLAVTAIGDDAFFNHQALTSVVIPEGVTSIGTWAFSQCWNLQFVSLPDTLVTIGDGAFGFCLSLAELDIPAATTRIMSAFYSMPTAITVDSANTAYKTVNDALYTIDGKTLMFCPNTKQGVFIIPEGTVTIDKMAFFGCGELTEIHIPASVTTIVSDAFGETYAMTGFVVDEDNTAYKSVNGMLLSKNGTLLHTVPMTVSGTLVVPDGVKTIGACAFRGKYFNHILTEVVLPDGVTTLEREAFLNQPHLEKINLPASLVSFGNFAFDNVNSECVATVFENTPAHLWCVDNGILVNVLENPSTDDSWSAIHASRIGNEYIRPTGMAADFEITDGAVTLQCNTEASNWDYIATTAEFKDGQMCVPVDIRYPYGASSYRHLLCDSVDEDSLTALEQRSPEAIDSTFIHVFAYLPFAGYDRSNQLATPQDYEKTLLIQWLNQNGEVLKNEKLDVTVSHTSQSSRSARINYYDMSTVTPNYLHAAGISSHLEGNTLVYSVPEDYSGQISTCYPVPEGTVSYRLSTLVEEARWSLRNGAACWSRGMLQWEPYEENAIAMIYYDEDDNILGCEKVSIRFEIKSVEETILPLPASRIHPDTLPFGMEASVTVNDGLFKVVIDDEATSWDDVFTFLEPMPWHNPDTGESGFFADEVMAGAQISDLGDAVYSKSVVGNVWTTDEEILAALEQSDDVQDLTSFGHGWWHDIAVLDREAGTVSLNEIVKDPSFGGDYTYAIQWMDAEQNILATEKVVFEITHTNPEKRYSASRTLIPAESIVGNAENMSGVTWEAVDGYITTTVEDKDITTTTEIISPENAVTYSMPELDTNGERWDLSNGRVGFQRVGWSSVENQTSHAYLLCWYDADGDLIGGGWITMTDVCPMPELILPDDTKEIQLEAFAGSGVQRVLIPDGCTTIGERAFANCTQLQEVHIPASVTSIADNAFEGSTDDLKIYAPIPSTGANFAHAHDIQWVNVSSLQ